MTSPPLMVYPTSKVPELGILTGKTAWLSSTTWLKNSKVVSAIIVGV